MLPAVKTEKFLTPIFSYFNLVVSASENDAKSWKEYSFIAPVTRNIGQNLLQAMKMEKDFFVDFSNVYLAISASKMRQ